MGSPTYKPKRLPRHHAPANLDGARRDVRAIARQHGRAGEGTRAEGGTTGGEARGRS